MLSCNREETKLCQTWRRYLETGRKVLLGPERKKWNQKGIRGHANTKSHVQCIKRLLKYSLLHLRVGSSKILTIEWPIWAEIRSLLLPSWLEGHNGLCFVSNSHWALFRSTLDKRLCISVFSLDVGFQMCKWDHRVRRNDELFRYRTDKFDKKLIT